MTLHEMLMQLVAPVLAAHGFTFSEARSDRITWVFVRQMPTGTHTIYWVQHRYLANALGVQLQSSAFGTMPLFLLFNGQYPDFLTFSDEGSQQNVVEQLLHQTVQIGIPWLDAHSIPPMAPPEEQGRRLVIEAQSLAFGFAASLELSLDDARGLCSVGALLLQKRAESDVPDWNFMVGAAAYFGEVVRLKHGGEWTWDSEVKRAIVLGCKSAKGDHNNLVAPLVKITRFWSTGSDANGLFESYRQFRHVLEST